MSTPNTPIVNAGTMYINNLQLSWNASEVTTLSLSAGEARDSTNTNDIILNDPVIIYGNFVGPNGMDQAPIANNSQYAVYVIASSTSIFTSTQELGGGPFNVPVVNPYPPAALLSLSSNTAPVLPFEQ